MEIRCRSFANADIVHKGYVIIICVFSLVFAKLNFEIFNNIFIDLPNIMLAIYILGKLLADLLYENKCMTS